MNTENFLNINQMWKATCTFQHLKILQIIINILNSNFTQKKTIKNKNVPIQQFLNAMT